MISLEYLFVTVLSLCLISVSLFSLIMIKDLAENSLENLKFIHSANSVVNSLNEVCALGNGNSQILFLSTNLKLESAQADMWLVRLSNGNFSTVKPTLCQVTPATLGTKANIKNENGIIKVR